MDFNFLRGVASSLVVLGPMLALRAVASPLGIECAGNTSPALIHAYVGEFEEGTYTLDASKKLSDEFNAVLRFVRRGAGLSNSAVSEPSDPVGGDLVENNFGGFLMFQDMPDRPGNVVEGMEYYWNSQPHLDFFGTYVDTLLVDDEGAAASVQMAMCVDKDYDAKPTGKYHLGLIVDLNDEASGSYGGYGGYGDECGAEVLYRLQMMPTYSSSSTDRLCGMQWPDYGVLSFSEGLDTSNWNKVENVNDVACVFNFETRSERDAFADVLYDTEVDLPCIRETYAWKME